MVILVIWSILFTREVFFFIIYNCFLIFICYCLVTNIYARGIVDDEQNFSDEEDLRILVDLCFDKKLGVVIRTNLTSGVTNNLG